jgi:hypothetical protein
MLVIVVMLLVAMIMPRGVFTWSDIVEESSLYNDYHGLSDSPRGSYAICVFRDDHRRSKLWPPPDSLLTMVISSLLLSLGFISRAIRLHRVVSVSVIGTARHALSSKVRGLLLWLYTWCNVQAPPQGLRRTLVYRPALAVFLTTQVGLNIFTSMFLEVSGSLNLIYTLVFHFFLCEQTLMLPGVVAFHELSMGCHSFDLGPFSQGRRVGRW